MSAVFYLGSILLANIMVHTFGLITVFGLTFPARVARWDRFPAMVRIDYIWHTPDLRATRSWIGPAAGSDHLPLFAELIWTDSP